jgi:hypothetical protein
MTDKNTQQGGPASQGDRTDQGQRGTRGASTPNPAGQPAPETSETERGGSHGAQSASRINEDEGDSGES